MEESKRKIIEKVEEIILEGLFSVEDKDETRPWGAFFRLKNGDAERFVDRYFPEIKETFITFENLSPKFLIVEPNKRLSWQYHDRRAEIWKVIEGSVGIKTSNDNEEPLDVKSLGASDIAQFDANVRHRLIGLDQWGIVAEIWKHTDSKKLSDESDIVRVQDDFGR